MSSDSQRSPTGFARLAALACALLVLIVAGCPTASRRGPTTRQGSEKELFNSIAETINTLEEYDTEQILPQLRDRLNHWQDQDAPEVEWRVDPLIAELPPADRNLAVMKTLEQRTYAIEDMILLQETVWLRDIARGADANGDLPSAKGLFDWTIRNIQLEPDGNAGGSTHDAGGSAHHYPMEILLRGRGNAAERAWIFMLLCRQKRLDAVMLAVPGEGDAAPRLWLPAVVIDKQLYLFDTRLGLPIPGPGDEQVATLEQVAADDSLLRKLDLDAEHPYPWKADDAKHVVALLDGSPQYLFKRMKLVESQLASNRRVVLSTAPEAVAKRVTELPNVKSARLWTRPYEVIRYKHSLDEKGRQAARMEMLVTSAATPLSKGRIRQFKGVYTGDDGAKKHYLAARAPTIDIDDYRDQRERTMSKDPAIRAREQARLDFEVGLIEASNEQASLCLGLVAFEQADYPVAVDFFETRVLEASPDGPYSPSATYNLARTYEGWGLSEIEAKKKATELAMSKAAKEAAQAANELANPTAGKAPPKAIKPVEIVEPSEEDWGHVAKAVEVYEADKSKQSDGNKLRSRQVKSKAEALKMEFPKLKPEVDKLNAEIEKLNAEIAKLNGAHAAPKDSPPAKSDAGKAAPSKSEKPAEPEKSEKPEKRDPPKSDAAESVPAKVEPAKVEPSKSDAEKPEPTKATDEPAKPDAKDPKSEPSDLKS